MARFAFVFITLVGFVGCGSKPGPSHSCATLTDLGACVPEPIGLAQRTACDGVTSYCDKSGTTAPNLACLTRTVAPTPPTNSTLTLTGFVRALDSGPDTSNLTVQVINPSLLVNGANPGFVQTIGARVTALDGSATCKDSTQCGAGQSCLSNRCWTRRAGVEPLQRACDTDPKLGCVFALSDGCNHSCNDGLDGRRDDGNYCRDDGSGGTCRPRLRWEASYTIDNVPVDRALVMRIAAPGGSANTSWVTVVRWNLQFSTGARACSGDSDSDCIDNGDVKHPIYHLDLQAAAQSDWIRLAQQSGLTGGVLNGDGVVFGEVHDCDDVRLSGVAVGVKPAAALATYFSADPLALRPDVTRAAVGTDPLGRFALWGVRAGRVTVDTAGLAATLVPLAGGGELGDGGEPSDAGVVVRDLVRSFGRDDIFVYDGTLSIVTINGGRR